MVGFCSVMDAPHVVHTTKNKVDQNLWGVHQEDVQFCLKYPSNKTLKVVDCAKW